MKITIKKITVGLFFLIIIAIMYGATLANEVKSINELFVNKIALENLYFISQIIGSLFVAVGVFVAGWQYILTSKSEIAKNQNEKVQKAIDLSEYYKNHILDKYCLLFYVFQICNMTKIIDTVKITDMNNFDIYELEENFSKSELDQLGTIIESKTFAKAVIQAIIRFDIKVNKNLFQTEVDGENKQQIGVHTDAIINDFLNDYVCETLNCLEFFAMHFTHGAAEESVVYQSLHKTYLEMVQILYYNIAKNNKDSKKLYTNVIALFNDWKIESLKQKQTEVSSTRNTIIQGSVCNTLK